MKIIHTEPPRKYFHGYNEWVMILIKENGLTEEEAKKLLSDLYSLMENPEIEELTTAILKLYYMDREDLAFHLNYECRNTLLSRKNN